MRRRPVAVYRVIDEAELLGEPPGEAPDRPTLQLADDPDADLVVSVRSRLVATALLIGGVVVLLVAVLVSVGTSTVPAHQLQAGAPTKLARLAVAAQKRLTDQVEHPLEGLERGRGPRRGVEHRPVRKPRPPRIPVELAPTAPPAPAPTTQSASPANEFGFER
ncbi:MAG: hypothetical protein ABSC56_10165 [Solirubrobacteraceae bacterium]